MRVLVVAPAWVGDMVMSQVIYAALRQQHEDLHLDVLAPASTLSLVKRMPEVNRGILLNQQHGQLGFGYRQALGKRLQEEAYDWAILTPNSLKSALIPFFAGIPKRTGFLGEYRYFLLNDIKLLDKKRLPRMTDRFLALVEKTADDLIKPRMTVDHDNQQQLLERFELSTSEPVVGICPGAEFGDAKKWPEAHYADLAARLIETGRQVWILGSPADASTGEMIAEAAGPGCVNLAGQTELLDAIDLLASCESVVSNDSGLMHLAAAAGTPVLGIYGSTTPDFTPPLTEHSTTASLELPCRPCFKRTCPLSHKNCLNLLKPEVVHNDLNALIARLPVRQL